MQFLHTISTILSNNSTIFPVDKEFLLVYLVGVFKNLMGVCFVLVFVYSGIKGILGDWREAIWLFILALVLGGFMKVR